MSEAYCSGSASGAIGQESGHAPALGAAGWLGLAAAPTFAIMALLTGVLGGGSPDMLCSTAQDASPLSGMVPMYLLMSAFHSAPWLKLILPRTAGALPQDFGSQRPGQRAFLAHRFAVELSDDGASGGNRPFDPFGEETHQAFVDRELPVNKQFDQHGAQ